jgi:meiosis-specific transcription factor NDT80
MADTESEKSAKQSTRQSKIDQEGPPFEATVTYHIMTGQNHHQQLTPEIIASIRGTFFQVDDKWTCYHRNYLTVTCSFCLDVDGPYYLGSCQQVTRFAISISAKAVVNNQESEAVNLVQHTPKRVKRSETTPKLQVVLPTLSASLPTPGSLTVNNHTCGGPQDVSIGGFEQLSCTFKRIQFKNATTKYQLAEEYFHVVVKLLGDIGRPEAAENWVTIATKQSFPMVVRGRSPSQ